MTTCEFKKECEKAWELPCLLREDEKKEICPRYIFAIFVVNRTVKRVICLFDECVSGGDFIAEVEALKMEED